MIFMPELALNIDDVSISYPQPKGSLEAVKSLSLQIRPGQFLALLGPNGAGKTSLITSIVGLTDIRSGSISVFGQRAGSIEAKRALGYVPQELVSYGFFTVVEILQFISGYFGIRDNRGHINELLDRLHLQAHRDKLVSRLSGGMKRRFLIAKALLHRPKLLLLDEPSAGVDVELRETLWSFVRELHASGTSVLLTTHYIEEAEQLSDMTAVIDRGQLIAFDATEELVKKMALKKIRLIFRESSSDWANLIAMIDKGVFEIRAKNSTLEFSVRAGLSFRDLLEIYKLKMDDVLDISMEEGTLEGAFKRLIART